MAAKQCSGQIGSYKENHWPTLLPVFVLLWVVKPKIEERLLRRCKETAGLQTFPGR